MQGTHSFRDEFATQLNAARRDHARQHSCCGASPSDTLLHASSETGNAF